MRKARPVSRTQWCCLTALLAAVVGLLCGSAARGTAGVGAGSVPVAASAPQAVAPTLRAAVMDAATVPGVPGCGKRGDHDGEPAVPTRARTSYDQAPGLAPWGLPAATGGPPAEPPPGIRVRAPVTATPTPVELSVLRV